MYVYFVYIFKYMHAFSSTVYEHNGKMFAFIR